MGQKIHFEDNIFFLNEIIRTLQRNVLLKPDPEFFFNKIIEEISFLDDTCTKLCNMLSENTHLINRQQYLRYLMKTITRFINLIKSLKSNSSFDFSQHKHALDEIAEAQESNCREIQRLLFTSSQDRIEEQVSAEEFKHLFFENS